MTRVQATGKAAYNYSVSSSSTAFIDAILNHGRNTPSRKNSTSEEIEEINKDEVDCIVCYIYSIITVFFIFQGEWVLCFPSFDTMNSQILAGYLQMSDINKY